MSFIKVNKKYTFNSEVLSNPTPEFSYFLGWMWGDGHCRRGSSYRIFLEIEQNDMNEILPHFLTFSQPSISSRCRGDHLKVQTLFALYDFHLGEFLFKMDYPVKSKVSADKILDFLPKNLHEFWFRGFFEADGCISLIKQTKSNHFFPNCNISGPFDVDWSFLSNFLNEHLITFKIRRDVKIIGRTSSVYFQNQDGVKKFKKAIYSSNLNMSLSRKLKIFNKCLEYFSLKRGEKLNFYTNLDTQNTETPQNSCLDISSCTSARLQKSKNL